MNNVPPAQATINEWPAIGNEQPIASRYERNPTSVRTVSLLRQPLLLTLSEGKDPLQLEDNGVVA